MQKITVEVDLKGNSVVSVNGVKGKKCKDLTKNLEKALGKVMKDTATKEMHEEPTLQHLHQS